MTPALIQQFIGNINNFNVIFLLTGGGPTNSDFYGAGSTDLLVTWLYNLTLNTMDYNLASVIGILIFILSAVFSLIAYTRTNSFKEG
jgi:arabinogalactan oligomer/maltooligosaccharide transport system permease protein